MSMISYFSEVRKELAKVEWPGFTSVVKLTILVLLISAIVGVYVGGLDFGFTKILESLVK